MEFEQYWEKNCDYIRGYFDDLKTLASIVWDDAKRDPEELLAELNSLEDETES